MKLRYKGKRPVGIPSVGLFIPNESTEVPDDIAEKLLKDKVPGIAKEYERKTTIKKEVDKDAI